MNLFFLLIALLQIIPVFNVGPIMGDLGPVIIVTMISLIKEITDELQRKRKDDVVNR